MPGAGPDCPRGCVAQMRWEQCSKLFLFNVAFWFGCCIPALVLYVCVGILSGADRDTFRFIAEAGSAPLKWDNRTASLDTTVIEAIEWSCEKETSEIIEFRERVTRNIEKRAEQIRHSRDIRRWLGDGCQANVFLLYVH